MTNLVQAASAYIIRTQESSMFDLCKINQYSETYDSYRDLTKTFTTGSYSASSICGIAINSGNETYKDELVSQENNITIRLPLTTSIDTQDTITVTRKNNQTINQTFGILNIDIGAGELVVKCQKLEV